MKRTFSFTIALTLATLFSLPAELAEAQRRGGSSRGGSRMSAGSQRSSSSRMSSSGNRSTSSRSSSFSRRSSSPTRSSSRTSSYRSPSSRTTVPSKSTWTRSSQPRSTGSVLSGSSRPTRPINPSYSISKPQSKPMGSTLSGSSSRPSRPINPGVTAAGPRPIKPSAIPTGPGAIQNQSTGTPSRPNQGRPSYGTFEPMAPVGPLGRPVKPDSRPLDPSVSVPNGNRPRPNDPGAVLPNRPTPGTLNPGNGNPGNSNPGVIVPGGPNGNCPLPDITRPGVRPPGRPTPDLGHPGTNRPLRPFYPWVNTRPRPTWWWYAWCQPALSPACQIELATCSVLPEFFESAELLVTEVQPNDFIEGEVALDKWYLGLSGIVLPAKGLGIETIEESSPAADSGLEVGMVITHCNGVELTDLSVLKETIAISGGVLALQTIESGDSEAQEIIVQMTKLDIGTF